MASLDHFFTCHTLIACHDAGAAQMIFDNEQLGIPTDNLIWTDEWHTLIH